MYWQITEQNFHWNNVKHSALRKLDARILIGLLATNAKRSMDVKMQRTLIRWTITYPLLPVWNMLIIWLTLKRVAKKYQDFANFKRMIFNDQTVRHVGIIWAITVSEQCDEDCCWEPANSRTDGQQVQGVNWPAKTNIKSARECAELCKTTLSCNGFHYHGFEDTYADQRGNCYLKTGVTKIYRINDERDRNGGMCRIGIILFRRQTSKIIITYSLDLILYLFLLFKYFDFG